jgi:DNA-binding SARP family transcriptional activator
MGWSWRIELLGQLRAGCGDREITRFRSRQTSHLLAYLAYHLHRSHPREQLCELLWPHGNPDTAFANLRNVLRWLRQELEPPPVSAGAVIAADRAAIRLNPTAVTTDVAEFEAALQTAAQAGTRWEQIRCLTLATDLYRGELLAGWHESWILGEREWLSERFFQALARLIVLLEQAGDWDGALEKAHRGVGLDPLREESHATLMRLYAAVGRPDAALRQFRELDRILTEELETTPSAATRSLARQIERQRLTGASLRGAHWRGARSAAGDPAQDRRWLSGPSVVGVDGGTRAEGGVRLVTVLRMGPPAFERRTDVATEGALSTRLYEVMVDAALKYDGQVVVDEAPSLLCHPGGGMLAVFGMLETHEDDAERAVQAALAIRDAAGEWGRGVAAGIATGAVILDTVARDGRHERTVLGPVADLAVQLQQEARPGQILVGETTRYQARRAFEFIPLSVSPDGAPQPIPSYAVSQLLPRPEKARGIEGRRADLIGRDEELAKLRQAVAAVLPPRARDGAGGHLVCLQGEAGTGKSRLVAELKAVMSDEWIVMSPDEPTTHHSSLITHHSLWLEGRCLDRTMTTGYSVFIDLLQDALRQQPEHPEASRIARALSLLSGEDADRRRRSAAPERTRDQTLHALKGLFLCLAQRQPTVLVLEDLHWADTLSMDLVSLLMEALPEAPLLLLCIYRPEREHRCVHLPAMASRKCPEQWTDLTLRELTPAQHRRMTQSLLRTKAPLPAPLEAILAKTHGNPFFVEEVIHSLIETGALYQEGDAWRIGTEIAQTAPAPESIQRVIMSRVDRLPPEARQALRRASVLGRIFRLRVLERLQPERIASGDGRSADCGSIELLWALEERGLLYLERGSPEEEYAFKHMLMQETIYDSLLPAERAELHRQAGEALEALHTDDRELYCEEIAHHFERSACDEKAVEYLLKAGAKAGRAYLNDAAIGYLQRALDRLDRSGLGEARKAWTLEALRGLGQICHRTSREAEAEEWLRRTIALGEEIGLPVPERVRLYHWLSEVLCWSSRPDRIEQMLRVGEEGRALVGESTESVEAAIMNATLALALQESGDQHRSRQLTRRNMEFLLRLPYCEELRMAYDQIIVEQFALCKEPEGALRWAAALATAAEQCGDEIALGEALNNIRLVTLQQGDLREASSHARQHLDRFSRTGDARIFCQICFDLAVTALGMGQLKQAEEYIDRSRAAAMRLGDGGAIGQVSGYLGILRLCQGDGLKAKEAFEAALESVRDAPRWVVARETFRLARVELMLGNRPSAMALFESGLAGAGEDPCPLAEGASFMMAEGLSGLEAALGDPEAFRAFCARFRRRFPEGTGRDGGPFLARWFLEPAQPRRSPRGAVPPVHEPFGAPLAPHWAWTDPFGDCLLVFGEPAGARRRPIRAVSQDGLEIHAANGRDLRWLNLSAPRLLRRMAGDFAIETISVPVAGTGPGESPPTIGGLLLWGDQENYLRLDRGTRGAGEISFQGCVAIRERVIGRGRMPAERVYLRLERQGQRVTARCSPDGDAWFSVGHADFHRVQPVEVGVFAVGEIDRTIYPGAYPDGTGIRFESVTVQGSGNA